MSKAHDVGRLYVQRFRYPMKGAPRLDRADTVEVEPPYRIGRGVCVRYTPRRALVVGWWGLERQEEETALYGALKASDMDVPLTEILTWQSPEPEEASDVLPVCAEPQPDADRASDASCGAAGLEEAGRTIYF